jgi:hypothetical protein
LCGGKVGPIGHDDDLLREAWGHEEGVAITGACGERTTDAEEGASTRRCVLHLAVGRRVEIFIDVDGLAADDLDGTFNGTQQRDGRFDLGTGRLIEARPERAVCRTDTAKWPASLPRLTNR